MRDGPCAAHEGESFVTVWTGGALERCADALARYESVPWIPLGAWSMDMDVWGSTRMR